MTEITVMPSIMRFSHDDYTKLEDHVFTTIRRRSKHRPGKIVEVVTPKRSFTAKVLLKINIEFADIPESLLVYDTFPFAANKDDARAFLQRFYKKPIMPDEQVCIYLLEREEIRNFRAETPRIHESEGETA